MSLAHVSVVPTLKYGEYGFNFKKIDWSNAYKGEDTHRYGSHACRYFLMRV